MEIVRKNENGNVTHKIVYSYSCEKGAELKKALEDDPSLANKHEACTLITRPEGQYDEEGTREAVKCPELLS
jgi:hypothetical protein